MSERVRTFAAVVPPAPIRETIARMVDTLVRGMPGVRPVPAANLHLTLRFFGDLDPASRAAAVGVHRDRAAAARPFPVVLRGAGVFPSVRRPRVLWIGVEEGGLRLEALARELERGYREAGLGESDKPFHPHLTVGRWGRNGGKPPSDLGARLATVGEVARFQATSVDLMGSRLDRSGARYRVLDAAALGGAG